MVNVLADALAECDEQQGVRRFADRVGENLSPRFCWIEETSDYSAVSGDSNFYQ